MVQTIHNNFKEGMIFNMRKIRKPLSIVLVLMLALSMFSMCATAGAAEIGGKSQTGDTPANHNGTITVTSNVGSSVSVNYDYYNDAVTVTYKLQSTHKIVNTQSYVEYDPTVLQLGEVDQAVNLPKLDATGSAVMNVEESGKVYINASNINLYNFSNPGIYYTQTFNIIGTGDTTVNLHMEILTGSDQADGTQATDKNDVTLVDKTTALTNEFSFTAEAVLSGEEPTTAEPTTEEPTTVEPTTEPVNPVTISVAAPKSKTAANNWSDGVDFVYGSTTDISKATRVAMTDTGKVLNVTTDVSTLTSGEWKVYTVELTAEQVTAANGSIAVGFAKTGSAQRTKLVVSSGSSILGNGKLADYDGKTFVIDNYADAKYITTTYTGQWSSEEPVDPSGEPVKVYVAAPKSSKAANDWSDGVDFVYGASSNINNATRVAMTATGKTLNVNTEVSTLESGKWAVYAVELTPEQAEAINASVAVGFAKTGSAQRTKYVVSGGTSILGSGTINYCDKKVFVINGYTDSKYITTTYTGQWLDASELEKITINVAAPTSGKAANDWSNGVDFVYGASSNINNATRIAMTDTGKVLNVTTDVSTLTSGEWKVYTVQLTPEQAAEIDSSVAVGFAKTGAAQRTKYVVSGGTSILGSGKIEDNDNKTFVINGYTDSKYITTTYTGQWTTEEPTDPAGDTVTLYIAAPKSTKTANDWTTGVDFVYGSTTDVSKCTRIAMTDTNTTVDVVTDVSTLTSGAWEVYSVTLTSAQVSAVKKSIAVGFAKTGSAQRTKLVVSSGSSILGSGSIDDYNNKMFIINGYTDAKYITTTYTGQWS